MAKEPSNKLEKSSQGQKVVTSSTKATVELLHDMNYNPVAKREERTLRGRHIISVTGERRYRSIDETRQAKEISDYIVAVVADGHKREPSFADEVLRHLEKSLPDVFAGVGTKQAIAPVLPDVAPELFQGLRGPETPPDFIKRVYGPWLGHGLDRAHIRHLDPVLSTAINNWLKKDGAEWPADVDLPTRKQQNDRLVDTLQRETPSNLSLRDAQRVGSIIQRRRNQANK